MIADFDHLWQEIDQVWNFARQAHEYNRMARERMTRTQQEVRLMYRRALTACMTSSMPTANAWTREITATILASRGLLARHPPGGRHRRSARPMTGQTR